MGRSNQRKRITKGAERTRVKEKKNYKEGKGIKEDNEWD
jgi:hypothetical protein